ncbi:52 kDa repressor of the inhibitor of the protein kinase [Caligus rogercresseyi]|uniref:52 kDa repressor of the inhibitor of the protein kinase n=1 Tax=Caligus rogercresseyi TaxID=217165 RepID=A0A7T8KHN8_CALRO|nr:52 kDa repressor of the inhibitor of the protein kinase [Caligus rogercresseyi]
MRESFLLHGIAQPGFQSVQGRERVLGCRDRYGQGQTELYELLTSDSMERVWGCKVCRMDTTS